MESLRERSTPTHLGTSFKSCMAMGFQAWRRLNSRKNYAVMKSRLVISCLWIVTTFLLLSAALYAANDYESNMLAAVVGQPGVQPTLDRAKALGDEKMKAKTIEEAGAINGKIIDAISRYLHARNGSRARQRMISRIWLMWGVSAFVPLMFLWSSPIATLTRRFYLDLPAARGRSSKDEAQNESHAT